MTLTRCPLNSRSSCLVNIATSMTVFRRTVCRWLAIALPLFVLSGCALKPQQASTQVEVKPNTMVNLPAPADLGYQLTASQLITATWHGKDGNESSQLPVQLQVDNSKVVLAGFSSWGTRIMSLTYQDDEIQANVLNGLENTLPAPEQILFNLMVTLWPLNAWEASLNKIKWHITDSERQRLITDETGATVIIINYDNDDPLQGTIRFTHQQLGYSIVIDTLNFQLNNENN